MKSANPAPANSVASATIEGNFLVIRLPLQDPTPSTSGKTLVVASTRGNITSDAVINGQRVVVGANAYVKR